MFSNNYMTSSKCDYITIDCHSFINTSFAVYLGQCRVVLERIDEADRSKSNMENSIDHDEGQAGLQLVPNQSTVRSEVLWLPQSSGDAIQAQNKCETSQDQSIDGVSPDSVPKQLFVEVKKENESLKKALQYANIRLGDQTVQNSSTSSIEDEVNNEENPVNTRHYQIDSLFAPKYFYITNVSCKKF